MEVRLCGRNFRVAQRVVRWAAAQHFARAVRLRPPLSSTVRWRSPPVEEAKSPMKILLYTDGSVPLDLPGLAKGLSALHSDLDVSVGTQPFAVAGGTVQYPDTYRQLPGPLREEAAGVDFAVCCTAIRYDNNFFFESSGPIAILSFYAWDLLTTLSPNNGLVYFLATFIANKLPFGDSHEETNGCIKDFLADKTGVDIGMRSAFVCADCERSMAASTLSPSEHARNDVLRLMLDDLSRASRPGRDIVTYWTENAKPDRFDVFLCYNSDDRAQVRELYEKLRAVGLRPWLDEEQLRPGLPWQQELDAQIGSISSAAVLVGKSKIGPWQNLELGGFLIEFIERRCPVIPVLLPYAASPPPLPRFLRQMTWVDLRDHPDVAMKRLIWGITGRKADISHEG